MSQKSAAYYRFCQDRASGKFSYYDPDEIDDIACQLIDDGNMDDAQYLAEMGLRLHPDDENINKLVIWIYIHNHRVEDAERMFERYKSDGTDSTLRLKFCLMVLRGHPQQALTELTDAYFTGLITAADWINSIEEMAEAIPHESLTKYLMKVGETDIKDAETIARIGAKLIDCGALSEAVPVLNKALDIDAYDIFTWQDLARCQFELQNIEKATEACDFGLAIDSQNALLNFTRGYIHYSMQEWDEAVRKLEVARRFAEGKAETTHIGLTDEQIQEQISVTYDMLGTSYFQTGNTDKAIECFEILNERMPSNASILMQLASMHMVTGNSPRAVELAKQASELEPEDVEIRALLVSIYTTMHKLDDAVSELESIIRMKPKNKNFLIAYAELQMHLNNTEKADEAFRILLELKPKDKATRTLLLDYFSSIGDQDALGQLGAK